MPLSKATKITQQQLEDRNFDCRCCGRGKTVHSFMIVDFRKQQREHPPIHIDETVVEKVESLKFLSVHITDKLKWSTHTDSVVKKAQQRLFNLRSLKKCGLSHKTLTNFYRCTIESILSGCITAWYGNCSAHNRKSEFCTTHHRGQTTCPPRHLQHPMSQEGQKVNHGQQPPEPLLVHPVIIQKARSVQVHQSWDRETEKQLH
ncbi:uncharacterized protein ACWYII_029367 isoform 1-T2 [Salvelinus alpinus]